MGYIARLRKGALIFDLDGTNGVGLMDDFIPPSAQLSNNITTGLGANFYGGGEFISRKASPISFSFSVRSMASSNAQAEQQIDRLANFLAIAGDKRDPVWFEFRPDNNVGFEPLWGQTGAFRRVEVLALEGLEKSGYASLYNARNRAVLASVTVAINMPVLGNRQRVCTAAIGGMVEDWMGAKDGKSRGMIVPEATTNKMTNPVFGSATWWTGWAATAGVLVYPNIDPEFILFGNVSAKMIGVAAATFTQSLTLTADKHSCEFYMKRPDGAAITASDVVCYYDAGALATTYTSIGNGWYKVSAVNWDGIAAPHIVGLYTGVGSELYLSGAMCVAKTYNVPMCYGDMIGCAWTGTAHASTSSRSASVCWLSISDSTFNYGQWTIRLVWKADRNITGVEKYFLCDSTPKLDFLFTNADKFFMSDGTNNAESAVKSIVAGTTYVIHLTGSMSGLAIYLNGVSIATNATYTPPTVATRLYIGTDNSANKCINGTFKGLTTYDRAMTQAEVTADYNNILPLVTADKRVDWIPNAFYKSGGYLIYNYISAGVYSDNLIACGIPGDVPAETQFKLTPSASFTKSIWIGNHVDDYNYYIDPLYRFYLEGAGTATAATDSASNVLTIDLPTGVPRTGIYQTITFPDRIHGTFHYFARMRSSANTKTVGVGYYLTYNGGYIYTVDKTVSVGTTSSWYYLGKLSFEPPEMIDPGELVMTVGVNFDCSSVTDDLLVDFAEVINGDLCVIKQFDSFAPGDVSSPAYPTYVRMMGHRAFFNTNNQTAAVIGDSIELSPEVANTVTMHFANDAGAHVVANTLTVDYLDITPRWMTA